MRKLILALASTLTACGYADTHQMIKGDRGVWAIRMGRLGTRVIYCPEPEKGQQVVRCYDEGRGD